MRTVFCVLLAVVLAAALALQPPSSRVGGGRPAATQSGSAPSSRRDAMMFALAMPLAAMPFAASAAKYEKGSKEEKGFNDCLSICAYYCMKPKGQYTKSRTECLLECKPICKTDPSTKFEG
jgi:hypothetical protein